MGDFNCTRDEPPYQVILEGKHIKLKDPAPSNPPGTYCTFEVNSIPCKAIDYLFFSPQWSSSNYKVITDNDGKYYPSDHLPVIAEFKVQKKAAKDKRK